MDADFLRKTLRIRAHRVLECNMLELKVVRSTRFGSRSAGSRKGYQGGRSCLRNPIKIVLPVDDFVSTSTSSLVPGSCRRSRIVHGSLTRNLAEQTSAQTLSRTLSQHRSETMSESNANFPPSGYRIPGGRPTPSPSQEGIFFISVLNDQVPLPRRG